VRFADYASYMVQQTDEEPLYVFDEDFGEAAPGMLQWYKPPSAIGQDLAAVLRK
jgi:hypothetical protein